MTSLGRDVFFSYPHQLLDILSQQLESQQFARFTWWRLLRFHLYSTWTRKHSSTEVCLYFYYIVPLIVILEMAKGFSMLFLIVLIYMVRFILLCMVLKLGTNCQEKERREDDCYLTEL